MKQKSLLYLIMTALLSLTGCSSSNQAKSSDYKKLTAKEAQDIISEESDITILDVRTESEYLSGHIANSILLPYDLISEQAESVLPDKDQKILIYCRSGRRSEIAAKELISLGYTDVNDFGGIIDWPYEVVK